MILSADFDIIGLKILLYDALLISKPMFAKGKLAKFALRTLFSAGEAEQRGGRYFQ